MRAPSVTYVAALACELWRKRRSLVLAGALTAVAVVPRPVSARLQEHQPATPDAAHATAEEHAGAEHGGLEALMWPVANFIILAGGLYYVLRAPLGQYLRSRSDQIRKDLVDAAELNRAASAQIAEVDRKMTALPDEIAALRARGRDEITAEEERIASAAAADRARLLTQTRREIDMRLQSAQRELTDHAATLAVQLARQQLAKDMTPADHTRLVERYAQQVKGN